MGRGIAAATGSDYGAGSLALDVVGGALCAGVLVRGAQMLRIGGRAVNVASRSGQVFSSYRDAQRVTRGAGGAIEAHHLVEARHLRNWGLNAADGPAVILTRSEHQAVTNELRRLLPYGQQHSKEAVWEAYQQAYRNHQDWLHAIQHYFR